MSALKDVSVNVRSAVFGLISEIEKCRSPEQISQLTNELRLWLNGDVLSVVDMLKARLRTPSSLMDSVLKSGDTPKIVIREMVAGVDEEEDDMSCSEDDFNEPPFRSDNKDVTSDCFVPDFIPSTSTSIIVDSTVLASATPTVVDSSSEKVMFSTVSQKEPITFSLDISSC